MKKNPAKNKNLPTPKYDSRRDQNVLIEKMASDVKTIAEGHSGIIKRLDNIESDVSSIKTKVSEIGPIKMAVMENSTDIKTLKVGQKRIEQKLDTVITNHEQRLQKLEVT